MNNIVRFIKDDSGATAIEYGLLAALLSVAIIVAVGEIGTELKGTFETIRDKLKGRTVVPNSK